MTTRASLLARVSRLTGRGDESSFNTVVENSFDDFLEECANLYAFREMFTTLEISVSESEYSKTIPDSSLSGFKIETKHIHSASVLNSGSNGRIVPLTLKSYTWLDKNFPDRKSSEAFQAHPRFFARYGDSTIQLQAPSSIEATIYLMTSHMPEDWNNDDSLAIPGLAKSLVTYGVSAVYEAIEAFDLSDRWSVKARALRDVYALSVIVDPAEIHQAEMRTVGFGLGFAEEALYSLGDLQGLYPGDDL